jgi:Zn-dependent protease/predicted transcriptional regulator
MPLMATLSKRKVRDIPDLGQFFRVNLRLHRGWAIAFIVITAVVVTEFPEAYPLWLRITLGIAAVLLFFAALGIREVILNFLALSRDIPQKKITLFVFGGVSQVAEEETAPVLEMLLGMAGLLCNLIIAGLLYGVYSILVNVGSSLVSGLILWSAFLYFMLALFHFIPAFPLDGGRLLRALLWKVTGDYNRATVIASGAGLGIGLLLIAIGILLLVLAQQWFNGVALVFVGWVLQTAAMQSRRPVVLRRVLSGVKARDVVAQDCPLISRRLTLGRLVNNYILVRGQRYFLVTLRAKLFGVVSAPDIKKVSRKRWRSTTVAAIMTPASQLRTAPAEQSAASLLEQMNEWQIDYIPVLERDRVIGIVVRDNLKRLVKSRAEFGR